MSPERILWLVVGLSATLMLLHMMRKRQLQLVQLLKQYVEKQKSWGQRRSKIEQLAAQLGDTSPEKSS